MIENIKISELIIQKISGEWGEEAFTNNAVNIIRTANFTNSGIISFKNVIKRDVEKQKVEKKQLRNGDIIIEKSGGSPTQPVGRVVYFENPNEEIYLCNNFTTILRPNPNKVSAKYLFYLLYNFYKTEKVLAFQNKTTGIINLKLDRYLDSYVAYETNIETQNKIVAILDKAKAILDKREEAVLRYDELLRATFLEMFGNVADNPKKLSKKPLKEFGKIITGNTPPRSDESNYDSKYIEWIKTDNILGGSTNLTQAVEYLSETGFVKSRYVNENSLLVACIAGSISSIGRSAITDRKVAFNQQINAIVPDKDVSVYFLHWMFKVSAAYIQSFATGGMKRLLTKGEFEKIPFIKPDYNSQLDFEKIALYYSNFKSKLIQHQIQSETLLKSLSQQVFSDRIIIDVDAELESLISAIDLDKNEEENNIDTVINDITFIQRLIDRMNEHEFEDKDQYDKAKYILFRIMKQEEDLIKQIFKDNKIQLTLQNETA